jgi:hypothetical protein
LGAGSSLGASHGFSDFEEALQEMQVKEMYSATHPRSPSAATSVSNSEHGTGGGEYARSSAGAEQQGVSPYEYLQQLAVSESSGLILTSPPDDSSSLYVNTAGALKVEDLLAFLKMNPVHQRSEKSR